MNNIELAEARIKTLFELLDELMTALKKADPKIHKELVTNTKLNDFYLVRRGAK